MRRTPLTALALGLSLFAVAVLQAQTGAGPAAPIRRDSAQLRTPGPGAPNPPERDDPARDIRKDHHVVHQDALKVRRAEDRIAALERRVRRDRATLDRDEKAGRTARLEEDRESLKQAQGALAAERGRLALGHKN